MQVKGIPASWPLIAGIAELHKVERGERWMFGKSKLNEMTNMLLSLLRILNRFKKMLFIFDTVGIKVKIFLIGSFHHNHQ